MTRMITGTMRFLFIATFWVGVYDICRIVYDGYNRIVVPHFEKQHEEVNESNEVEETSEKVVQPEMASEYIKQEPIVEIEPDTPLERQMNAMDPLAFAIEDDFELDVRTSGKLLC